MTQTELKPGENLLKTLLAVFFVLAATDLAMQSVYTDFWTQPVTIQERLGVAGYEVLILFFMTSILVVPAWLLHRSGRPRAGNILFLLVTAPILGLLLLGWSFYEHFSRFIGIFAVQMILQDGGQLLQFVGKMPSAVNPLVVLAGLLVFAAISVIVLFRRSFMSVLRAGLSLAGVLVLVVAGASSSLWNAPAQVAQSTDNNGNYQTLQRLKDSKFQLLVNRAGPFTEIASSVTKTFFSQAQTFGIDTEKLEKIQPPNLATTNGSIRKYNIVFILVESLHPGVLQAFGSPDNIMPTVNMLSGNGYVLSNAWAQASHSNYADVAAISGQYPLRSMNIHFYPDKPDYPKSLPYDILRPHGYKAGLFSSQNERWGLMENYLRSDSIDAFSHVGSGSGNENASYRGFQVDTLDDGEKVLDYTEYMYQGTGSGIERLDSETTDEALAWMSTLDKQDPVFLYFNYQASHIPFNALPEGFERQFLTASGKDAESVKKGDYVGRPLNLLVDAYKDSLLYVDQNVGRVVDYMKKTGRHENTIYVISADTAIRLSGGLMGNGGELWPDVLKVPVVMSVPGVAGQTIIDTPLEQIDIMPTVLGLIGTGPHPASQGINFLSAENDPERVVYAVAQTPAAHEYSAIYKDWQLRHNYLTNEQSLHYAGSATDSRLIEPLSEQEMQWLAEQLRDWRIAQIGYYTTPQAYSAYYPPKFNSERWQARSGDVTLAGEVDAE